MRSIAGVAFVLALTRVANASPCSVNIVRAPDAVRDVITQWVESEHECGAPLDVRIVETSGGLYVLAQDQAGHVHERVVPDAQSAGVLIASWAAAPIADAPPPVTGEMSIDLSWTPPPVPVVAPGNSPVLADTAIAPAPRSHSTKWLSLGGAIGIGGAGAQGVRGELDLRAVGAWRVGLTGTVMHVDIDPDFGRYTGYLDLVDMKLAVYAAHVVDVGHWQLRASAGVGLLVTHGDGTLYDRADANEKAVFWPQISTMSPTGEASLSFSHGIGWNWPGWGLELGPVVTVVHESLPMNDMDLAYSRNALELAFFGGIRHRL